MAPIKNDDEDGHISEPQHTVWHIDQRANKIYACKQHRIKKKLTEMEYEWEDARDEWRERERKRYEPTRYDQKFINL